MEYVLSKGHERIRGIGSQDGRPGSAEERSSRTATVASRGFERALASRHLPRGSWRPRRRGGGDDGGRAWC
jgi:DNA-binding LacI/PurR family transcriptional regulator